MQIYEENEEIQRNDQIDLLKLADDMWKYLRRYWGRLLLLAAVIAAAFCGTSFYRYQPVYESYVTFAVSKNQTNAVDSVVAGRLANSFQYVLKSGRLESYIRKELGVVGGAAVPVSLSASAIEETNFLTVTAVSENDTQAQKAIEAVITYYPDLAYQIVGSADFIVIDQSGISGEPSNPRSIPEIVGKGLAAGAAVVVAILFLLAYHTSTIGSYEDLKKYLNVPCLGTIPLTKFKKRKKKFDTKISINNEKVPAVFKESINTLRTRVEKEMRDNHLKTLLISSSVPGEGKTTISLNLALSLRARDKKVLLIDADLRHPSLGTLVGAKEVKKGITDVLNGKSAVGDTIVYHTEYKIDMLLGRKAVSNASELLSSRRMQKLVDEVADYYDYIIVDTPPAAMLSDASMVAAYMDAMLYVIRQDFAKVSYISEGIGLLSDSDIYVMGCVLNCAEPGLGRYGYGKYGYGKYGYGRYGYGYGNE